MGCLKMFILLKCLKFGLCRSGLTGLEYHCWSFPFAQLLALPVGPQDQVSGVQRPCERAMVKESSRRSPLPTRKAAVVKDSRKKEWVSLRSLADVIVWLLCIDPLLEQ